MQKEVELNLLDEAYFLPRIGKNLDSGKVVHIFDLYGWRHYVIEQPGVDDPHLLVRRTYLVSDAPDQPIGIDRLHSKSAEQLIREAADLKRKFRPPASNIVPIERVRRPPPSKVVAPEVADHVAVESLFREVTTPQKPQVPTEEKLGLVFIKNDDVRASIDQIIVTGLADFDLSFDDILGPSRSEIKIDARDAILVKVFAAHKKHLSLPILGRIFNRDHTTILHALRKYGYPTMKSSNVKERL